MKIDLFIDGKKKTFTTPFVPMLVKRKYLEFQAKENVDLNNLTADQLDDVCSLLTDVVFKDKFTLEQLYLGATEDYITGKVIEAVYGVNPNEINENNEDLGNEKK